MIQQGFTYHTNVTLNLFHLAVTSFQGLFSLSSSAIAARWMLKQVQHDEVYNGEEGI